jgi:DNA-binding transcriptional ArsR family regulator
MPVQRSTPARRSAVLLHPVRMRVVLALAGSQPMTVHELAAHLGDVPVATLYRHVRVLAKAGVLLTVGERQVRGTTERRYALDRDRAGLTPADLATASPDELVAAFSTFAASLVAQYGAFVGQPAANPGEAAFFVTPLDLSDEQFATFGAELQAALQHAMTMPAVPGSRRRTLATILIPEPPEGDLS